MRVLRVRDTREVKQIIYKDRRRDEERWRYTSGIECSRINASNVNVWDGKWGYQGFLIKNTTQEPNKQGSII